MIANVNEKGRQTKLLAAIAVLAMVVCAFAVVMPSEDTGATIQTDVVAQELPASGITTGSVYYITADSTTKTYTMAENIEITLLVPVGTQFTITSVANGGDVTVYTYSTIRDNTSTTVTTDRLVTYDTDNGLVFSANSNNTSNITAQANGGYAISYEENTLEPTGAIKVIYSAENTTAQYYNVALAADIGPVNLKNGGSITLPAGEIPSNLTINAGSNTSDVFTIASSIELQTGTVAAVIGGAAAHDAFVVGADGITINSNGTTLTIASSASWTTGTVSVKDGPVSVAGTLTLTENANLDAVATNWVDTQSNVTLYASASEYAAAVTSGKPIIIYGDNTENINLVASDRLHVAAYGSYSGSVTYDGKSATVSVVAGESDAQYVAEAIAGTSGSPNTLVIAGTVDKIDSLSSGSNVTVSRISGDVTLSGVQLGNNMNISSTITVGAGTSTHVSGTDLIIPSTSVVTFTPTGSIVMGDNTNLYLYNTMNTGSGVDTGSRITLADNATKANIYGTDYSVAKAFCSSLVVYDEDESQTGMLFHLIDDSDRIQVSGYPGLVSALGTSAPIEITTSFEIPANAAVVIDNKDILFNEGVTITVKTGASLTIQNDSKLDQVGTRASIVTEADSQLSIYNSLIFMVVDVDEYGGITIDNNDVEYTFATEDVKVGFGTTLTLRETPAGNVMVYGVLNILESQTATIKYGYTMTVASGATVNMNGTLNVEGTVIFDMGSTGNLAGTVNVRNTNTGGAQFISDGNVEVSGTMTISNKSSTAPLQNELIVGSESGTDNVWTGFTVTGSLTVNGAISGILLDKGDITINGQVENWAAIILFDGVTLNVNSVSGGNLIVTDIGVSNEAVLNADGTPRTNTEQSSGNVVMLDDVRGITVSETVTSGNYTVNGTSHAYYISDMYVSGTASRVGSTTALTDENITITGVCGYVDTSATTSRSGAVHIAEGETLTLGEDVVMGNYNASSALSYILSVADVDPSECTPIIGEGYGQKLCVDGTLNVTGDGAKFLSGGKTWNGLNFNDGTIDVNGTVVIGPEAEIIEGAETAKIGTEYILPGDVNGVRYALQTTENNVTSTTIYYTNFDDAAALIADAVDDTITVYGNVSVGTSATIAANCNVILDTDAVLTINDGVTLTVDNGGKITGTQASIEVRGTMTSANYREDISVGEVGADVIVTEEPARTWTSFANALENASAPQTIELARDITLTANTTIPEGVTVTTEHNLNTSRYTLTVDGTLDILQGGDINIDGTPDDGNVVANGVVVMRSLGDSQANVDTLAQFDGAHFALRTGATVSNYVTNLAYAAENVTSGTITVTGAVSAGDVVFNEASNGTLVISVETAEEQEINTVLSFTTMDLNGATLIVDADSRVTGTVTAPYGDGTADAEIQLSRAAGEFTSESSSLATATGTEYTAYISNVLGAGSMTVAAGTVDVYHDEDIIGFKANGTFQVASGATLVVEDATLTANNDTRTGASNVTVSGTMNLDNGVLAGQSIVIDGTLNVIENAESDITIYAAGIIAVGEDATLSVNSKIIVGTAPESLGVGGQLTGSYRFTTTSAYILAYAGADLTGAQIDWNAATAESDALTTTYYINEIEYATVYASATNEVMIDDVFGADGEEIVLTGLNTEEPATGYAWKDAAGETSTVLDIGSPEAVYIEFAPANVSGVVTIGSGINLYIDGVQVSGYTGDPNGEQTIANNLALGVGTHRVSYEISAGWDGSTVVFTFNGETIENDSTITITADMTSFTLSATGATNSTGTSGGSTSGGDDGMGLTDYLLIVLVVLIVIMAIMVALRLMRS